MSGSRHAPDLSGRALSANEVLGRLAKALNVRSPNYTSVLRTLGAEAVRARVSVAGDDAFPNRQILGVTLHRPYQQLRALGLVGAAAEDRDEAEERDADVGTGIDVGGDVVEEEGEAPRVALRWRKGVLGSLLSLRDIVIDADGLYRATPLRRVPIAGLGARRTYMLVGGLPSYAAFTSRQINVDAVGFGRVITGNADAVPEQTFDSWLGTSIAAEPNPHVWLDRFWRDVTRSLSSYVVQDGDAWEIYAPDRPGRLYQGTFWQPVRTFDVRYLQELRLCRARRPESGPTAYEYGAAWMRVEADGSGGAPRLFAQVTHDERTRARLALRLSNNKPAKMTIHPVSVPGFLKLTLPFMPSPFDRLLHFGEEDPRDRPRPGVKILSFPSRIADLIFACATPLGIQLQDERSKGVFQ